MRRVLPLKIALVSLLIAACVTINVYFPAAAADKAADQFINDVTKGTSGGGSNPPPQSYFVQPAARETDRLARRVVRRPRRGHTARAVHDAGVAAEVGGDVHQLDLGVPRS